ncbi:hypothetical protein DH2020_045303 [Rehmannia glutinosa]|uniref:Uncharacterized protein n=1 Tax=Rehmannia glutinosa TaxID=99300 RepID=A0ABR0UFN1_REHGL
MSSKVLRGILLSNKFSALIPLSLSLSSSSLSLKTTLVTLPFCFSAARHFASPSLQASFRFSMPPKNVRLCREKKTGDIFAMKKLKKSEMLRRGQTKENTEEPMKEPMFGGAFGRAYHNNADTTGTSRNDNGYYYSIKCSCATHIVAIDTTRMHKCTTKNRAARWRRRNDSAAKKVKWRAAEKRNENAAKVCNNFVSNAIRGITLGPLFLVMSFHRKISLLVKLPDKFVSPVILANVQFLDHQSIFPIKQEINHFIIPRVSIGRNVLVDPRRSIKVGVRTLTQNGNDPYQKNTTFNDHNVIPIRIGIRRCETTPFVSRRILNGKTDPTIRIRYSDPVIKKSYYAALAGTFE